MIRVLQRLRIGIDHPPVIDRGTVPVLPLAAPPRSSPVLPARALARPPPPPPPPTAASVTFLPPRRGVGAAAGVEIPKNHRARSKNLPRPGGRPPQLKFWGGAPRRRPR